MDNSQEGSGDSTRILTPEPQSQTSKDEEVNKALENLKQLETSILEFKQKIEKSFEDERRDLQHQLEVMKEDLGKKQKELMSESWRNIKDQLQDKLDSVKERVIQTLAIFVALFTFVSVNFSFLANRKLESLDFFALDLLLSGVLIIFILLLRLLVVQKKNDHRLENFFMYIALALVILGIVLIIMSNSGLKLNIGIINSTSQENIIKTDSLLDSSPSGSMVRE